MTIGPLSLALFLMADGSGAPAGAPPTGPLPWNQLLTEIEALNGALQEDLGKVQALLRERAARENPPLAASIPSEPPAPRRRGFRVLPQILPDPPEAPVRRTQSRYSLRDVDRLARFSFHQGRGMIERAARAPLEPLQREFDDLLARSRGLEEHLRYHRDWQPAVVEHRDWFDRNSSLIARLRELDERVRRGAPAAETEAFRDALYAQIAPLRPAPGPRIELVGGERVLPFTVATDIEDEAFLREYRAAVEDAFVRSEAARGERFRIELTLRRLDLEALYPAGAPALGAPLDEKNHLARFPGGVPALTTGGSALRSFTGRSTILGPDSIPRRTLAHEFCHLLGFEDGYLRGYEVRPEDPFGCVLVECGGLTDDLLGSPSHGRVTPEMIRRVIQAYSRPGAPPGGEGGGGGKGRSADDGSGE